MNNKFSLLGLFTMLLVLKKNCNLSDIAIDEITVNNNSFESIVKQELNMSDMDLFRLLILCEKWEDGNNLDIFNFRLGE